MLGLLVALRLFSGFAPLVSLASKPVNDHHRILMIQAWDLSRAETYPSPLIWRFALARLLCGTR
jgi:hypothetical protein